jgi:hypothetical protein
MPISLLLSLALVASPADGQPAPAAPVDAGSATPPPASTGAATPAVAPPAQAPAAAPAAPATTAPIGSDNLWLVAPLYPGQELLVTRTEQAIHKLLPEGSQDKVGEAALHDLVQSSRGDLSCALGDKACRDPIHDYLRAMGLAKLVLIKGGQEEPNYRFEVTSTDLITGETHSASGSGPNLDKALLGALVKVAPLASSFSVATTPPGADVFLDGEKLGSTPLDGQILPGERQLKISSPGYKDFTQTLVVSARGEVKVNQQLEVLPSTLKVHVPVKTAHVFIDKKDQGEGDASVSLEPGDHTVEVKADKYETYTKIVTMESHKDQTLEPEMDQTPESNILDRSDAITAGFEQENFEETKGMYPFSAIPVENVNFDKNPHVVSAALGSNKTLNGFYADWIHQKGHFGIDVVGLSFFTQGGNINIYPDQGVFNNGTEVQTATGINCLDLRLLQPQANLVYWHFMFGAQVGLGVRAVQFTTPNFEDDLEVYHRDGYVDIAPYVAGQVHIRAYLIEGLFIQGAYKMNYMITQSSPTFGFTAGVGYAL